MAKLQRSFAVLGAIALLGACSSSDDAATPAPEEQLDQSPPLSDVDALFLDAPTNDKLPELGKADAVYPKQWHELQDLQSSVKSQGRRGVCSIFSTVGLMEHLYIKEGAINAPDFSEQHLQYAAKFDVGAFPKTSGSNARSNLDAITRFGIVEESVWPYEVAQWGTSDDAACDGEDTQPTRCYTNGEPPEVVADSERFYLPRGRWVSSRTRSIKAHMTAKKQAATVGLTFYYQSWNHGGSKLKTNRDYFKKGYVTAPNAEDKEKSLEKRAGHSILLVGWDDELEVQKRDGEGNLITDDAGEPVMETGFFVFKNSWGTGGFGKDHPYGAGYGYISYDYVEDEGSVYVADLPKVELPDENCGDGADNDRDGDIDCDDSDCSEDAACKAPSGPSSYPGTGGAIPDNDPTGIQSDVVVTDAGQITGAKVTVDIDHTYRGDLVVKLVRDDGKSVTLHDRDGGSADGLSQTYSLSDFNGTLAAGTWSLVVADHAKVDTGTLTSWSLELTTCEGADCGGATGPDNYSSSDSASIPDNDSAGVTSGIVVTDTGAIDSLSVSVDITHPYRGDLTLRLQKIGLGEVVLQQADAADGPFGTRTFDVSDFDGEDSAGTWRLVVVDEAQSDEGTLDSWTLTVQR